MVASRKLYLEARPTGLDSSAMLMKMSALLNGCLR